MFIFNILFIYLLVVITLTFSAPAKYVRLDKEKVAKMKFDLHLPSNETVQIHLSFKLLRPSENFPLYTVQSNTTTNNKPLLVDNQNITAATTIDTTTETPETTTFVEQTTSSSEINTTSKSVTQIDQNSTDVENVPAELRRSLPKEDDFSSLSLLTIEEAIESFRQNLILKEMEIAGIIESEHPFYRHFRLEYGDGVILRIRCTYEANYSEQKLKISCYEYRQFGDQRILSNGEIESVALPSLYVPDYINVNSVKQTYTMLIS